MNYTEETKKFINEVVDNLLALSNLQEDVNPLLTKELREKFQKADERFKQILESFNALPGVSATKYTFESDPDALIEITIPATSSFLNDKAENKGILCITAGFGNAKITFTDLGDNGNPKSASKICEDWQKKVFGRVSDRGEILNNYGAEAQMTIKELYEAVQELINSYLKGSE